jgi:hypothetical protein
MTRRTGPVQNRAWLAASLVMLLVALPVAANRRDQRAADLFTEGVRLIRAGKYAEGASKMRAALERASEPTDEQGSTTRFLARRYDPYYWLGVAQMEMGLDEQALQSFESSLSIVPVGRKEALVKGWPEEYSDLQRRMATLSKKLEAPVVVEVRPSPRPVPPVEPTLVAAALPTPPASVTQPPAATPTPFTIRIAGDRATPPPPVSPTPATSLAALDALISRYRALMADDVFGTEAARLLGVRVEKLESTRGRRVTPGFVETTIAAERTTFEASVAPVLVVKALQAALDAFGRQDWALVTSHLRRARAVDPASPRADILECAALATRYVLEGRKTERQLSAARESLSSWRAKVGSTRPLPAILSPGIRVLLVPQGAAAASPVTR